MKRDRSNGRYTYDSKMERICARCGNTLGNHEAEAPHANSDETMGPECEGFKLKK